MSTQTQNLTAAGASAAVSVQPGQSIVYSSTGTFTGYLTFKRSRTQGATWETVAAPAVDTNFATATVKNETNADERYRVEIADTDAVTPVTGTATTVLTDVNDTVRELKDDYGKVYGTVTDAGVSLPGTVAVAGTFTPAGAVVRAARYLAVNAAGKAKVGAGAGWVVAAADNKALVTCPASQTAATLVVPIHSLKVGDTITGFYLVGQAENTANAALTIDADLRKHTAAAADVSDASIGAITQFTAAADAILSAANTRKVLATAEVVGLDETFYVLITATTGAGVDIALQGIILEITEA